jgi:hypothetical protein
MKSSEKNVERRNMHFQRAYRMQNDIDKRNEDNRRKAGYDRCQYIKKIGINAEDISK